MIDRMPRDGCGYGIIRLSWKLTTLVGALKTDIELMSMTDMQGDLKDRGTFDQFKSGLYLPDNYTIHGIYIEPPRRTWCVLVEAPGIPLVDEGEMLPVVIPVYQKHFPSGDVTLLRIDIAKDYNHVLRVD